VCARRVLRSGPVAETVKGPAAKRQRDVSQAGLLFDPMPERVEPCLALLTAKPPAGEDWAYEVKWDGYRLAIHIEPDRTIRIITRGGLDWTPRFPSIAEAALGMKFDSAIIDGEAVVLDEQGRSDFGALQKALGGRGGKRVAGAAILYAFDVLYLDGRDLRSLSFDERRAVLTGIIPPDGAIRLSEVIDADGQVFLDLACQMGLEGIIAKKRSAPYRSGRGGEWLKIKCIQSETFVIIGYEPSPVALGGLGRLLLAARKGDSLAYVGGVGTGFGYATAMALRETLDAIIIAKPAILLKYKGARWVAPTLAVEIEFRGWTDDDQLRQASFKGLREDADMGEIYRL
jgi:bifunctional non-homologous end joining protein LigD